MTIGEATRLRIKELCTEREITRNNIVSGRNHGATVSTVQKICDGLEIHIRDFFASPLFDEPEQEVC